METTTGKVIFLCFYTIYGTNSFYAQPENLDGSGLTVVLNTTLFAIIGAISLQHGAEVAGRVAREKILKRL